MDYKKCSTVTSNRIIVLQENRSKFQINNHECYEAKKIKVDGCLIEDNFEKCDWIVTCENPSRTAIFVELKGCNIDKAISQLKSTLALTTKEFQGYEKKCFAVTTRIPKQQTSIRKKCIDFQRETKVCLSVKNQICSINLEQQ